MATDQPIYPIEDLRREISKLLEGVHPHTPVAVTTLFELDRNRENAFGKLAAELERETRQMRGLDDFDIRKQVGGGASVRYLIDEEWSSVDAFRENWKSGHLRSFQDKVGTLLNTAPIVTPYIGKSKKSTARVRILATGQTQCWDASGNLIDGKGSGQDGDVRAGLTTQERRFRDDGNGTVTDNLTGLIWLKDSNAFGEVPWEQALQIVKTVQNGVAGLSDGSKPGEWRMPNINELQSLLVLDNATGPAISPTHPFRDLQSANYWSSTTVAAATPLGWYTALAVGPPVFDLKFNSMRIWPVRGGDHPHIPQTGQTICYNSFGQPIPCEGTGQDGETRSGVPFPEPRFTDHNDGTVTDNLTGLVWLRDANPFGTKKWEDALAACNQLASGHADLRDNSRAGQWRLPNLFELRSLMDYSQFGPALTKGHPFRNVQTSLYWSSTTVPSAPNLARFVFVGIGPSVWDHKSVYMNVWPVRDQI